MKLYIILLAVVAISQMVTAGRYNVVCFYDTFSIQRGGFANFTETDLKTSLEYCTHIVYGYVGLTADKFDIATLHPRQHQQFSQVKMLKNRYRHIKFLLSLGGDKDLKNSEKYKQLLDTNPYNQQNFISSARTFLRKYNFDGLDLAYQFPRNKVKSHSTAAKMLRKAKDIFKNNVVGQKVTGTRYSKKLHDTTLVYKQRFTELINKLKNTLRRDGLMLSLTVLPHVNASHFINIPVVIHDLDFVNLGTFDYSTPERTPHQADFLAPLQALHRHNQHLPQSNIENDVQQWLVHHISGSKLNIGIAAYARAWRMTKALKSPAVMPITSSIAGPSQGGLLTRTPGLLSLPEYCLELKKMDKSKNRKNGNYAYRSANVKGHEGLLITYDDQESLAEKAEFVKKYSLGGVAIFDLTLDDFRDKCGGGKFPTLKSIKFKLY